MRSEYYGSAKVTYFDKEAVWKAVRKLAARLAEEHPEIARISVFGSLVRDEAVPGSDVDLLLILEESDLPIRDRVSLYRPENFPVSIDVFAYTREEVQQALAEGDFFLKRAVGEAIKVFEGETAK